MNKLERVTLSYLHAHPGASFSDLCDLLPAQPRPLSTAIRKLVDARALVCVRGRNYYPVRDAVQVAEQVKAKLNQMLLGALSPDFMYVLGPEPVVQGDPPQEMSLQTHGWGDWREWYDDDWREQYGNPPYAELCAEEAADYLVHACEQVAKPGTWDMYSSCVAVFYGDLAA